MEYILYCDESSDSGLNFGDFFGGCLISSAHLLEVTHALEEKKQALHLTGEPKWTKVSESYLQKYIDFITLFFEYVRQGKVKMRIMFQSSRDKADHPLKDADDKYFKLYYQFIKHAFGFKYICTEEMPLKIRIYLDQLPDKKTKCDDFKKHLRGLPTVLGFDDSQMLIRDGDIAEVASHNHVLLQCVDIVLGAMYFRLNDLHRAIPPGKSRRGKRTIAKEQLYKHILQQIRTMYPRFNIGISSGKNGDGTAYWDRFYAHWQFIPYESQRRSIP